jgi:hypothetical protein
MKNRFFGWTLGTTLIVLLLFAQEILSFFQAPPPEVVGLGLISRQEGSVTIESRGGRVALSGNTQLSDGDRVTTSANTYSMVQLSDGTDILLMPESLAHFRKGRVRLSHGRMRVTITPDAPTDIIVGHFNITLNSNQVHFLEKEKGWVRGKSIEKRVAQDFSQRLSDVSTSVDFDVVNEVFITQKNLRRLERGEIEVSSSEAGELKAMVFSGRFLTRSRTQDEGRTLKKGEKLNLSKGLSQASIKALLPPPHLLSPADKQTALIGKEPSFNWSEVDDASEYEIEVAYNTDFSQVLLRQHQTDSQLAAISNTETGDFFWRVRSVDREGDPGPWSSPRKLTLRAEETLPEIVGLKWSSEA